MSRFASKKIKEEKSIGNLGENYVLGHHDEVEYEYRAPKGIDEGVVRDISRRKAEPKWMLEKRLSALKMYNSKELPNWGADLSPIRFDNIHYYLKPKAESAKSWDEVPDKIKETFEKIGVPEAERERV